MKMVNYEVTVFTGSLDHATTYNDVYIKLMGTDGESCRTQLRDYKGSSAFARGAVSSFTVPCPVSIGKLLLIELDKQRFSLFPEEDWFPDKVEIKSPEEVTYTVPIYRWITDSKVHRFREGTALRVFEDNHRLGRYSRDKELKRRKEEYRMIELKLEVLANCKKKWKDMHHLNRAFWHKTHMADYVQEHWKEDVFFGYQYLNGINPMLIRRCTALPSNFPVTDDMVFLHGQSRLEEEMKKGNIFLADYKILDGVKQNVINRKKQYLMAPLVLLHKTPQDQLMPVAIQLKQTPADDNPIFFPTDSEYDWLMAKIFVRSADFNIHELNVHLLRTHLLAEVFTVSLLRNVPMVHPLYKLLIHHTRYTLQINILARLLLISKTGVFTKYAASGGEGMITILRRSMSSMTYSSLCIPDDIAERGLEDVPNFHYRDDGLRLWDIISRFVQGVLGHYYKNDAEVKQDSELQKWISDIFVHGFLSKKSTGIPQSFTSVAELVKFVTMVIFTSSAQHAAVSSGQYDFDGWMPNAPTSLQCPPPTKKGTTNEATMLDTFPDVSTTVHGMAVVWLLSKQSTDFVPLGHYPKNHFTEETPCKLIKEFQERLEEFEANVKARNGSLGVPYTYLIPAEVENSVTL
ncbi:polyunsaturated fatty acid lipoxygenase ALOX15B-like isoform X2 [Acanthopagrus latus]|uniref:polyunsaturated fatty acid lipoxygenase ALOX15B-like isoform X2 n=1 Tax=Acanthopagrus latus TaxID=8177 RepID=UPI00187CD73E|nr:polyunsaturated fatty acid lipoxygenase ALOX15B-like isoform X2 [Acanthopagrus latus]